MMDFVIIFGTFCAGWLAGFLGTRNWRKPKIAPCTELTYEELVAEQHRQELAAFDKELMEFKHNNNPSRKLVESWESEARAASRLERLNASLANTTHNISGYGLQNVMQVIGIDLSGNTQIITYPHGIQNHD